MSYSLLFGAYSKLSNRSRHTKDFNKINFGLRQSSHRHKKVHSTINPKVCGCDFAKYQRYIEPLALISKKCVAVFM